MTPLEKENNQLRGFLKTYNEILSRLIKNTKARELFGVESKKV